MTDLALVEAMVANLAATGGIDRYGLNAGANMLGMVEDPSMAHARTIM